MPTQTQTPALTTLNKRTVGGLQVQPVTERTPYFNILIYGDPGAGKTVLAGSASNVSAMAPVLLIDVEGGTFSLRSFYPQVDVVRVQSMMDMQRVYEDLEKGATEYRTVVLDSLSEIQKFGMGEIMKTVVKNDPDRDPDIPSVREWGKNLEQVRRVVRGFRDLRMNVIFTALANSDKDQRTGLTKTRPALSGKLAYEVAGFVDIVAYMYSKPMGDQLRRLLLTRVTDTVLAKDRSNRLPQIMQDPTMKDLHDTIMRNTEEGHNNES